MLARQPPPDRAFMQEAAEIVVSEIDTLERRVRAFSEFSSEPVATPEILDVDAVVRERFSLLRPGHPGLRYELRSDAVAARAWASPGCRQGGSSPTSSRTPPRRRARPGTCSR